MMTLFYACGVLLWIACVVEIVYQIKLFNELKTNKAKWEDVHLVVPAKEEILIKYTSTMAYKKMYTEMYSQAPNFRDGIDDNITISYVVMNVANKEEEKNLKYINESNFTNEPIYGCLSIA